MKLITLTQGQFAQVDDDDYEFLNQWKWQAQKGKTTYYAVRTDYSRGKRNRTLIYMHCLILDIIGTEFKGDHIDRNGLNDQRSNLRIATYSQNQANRRSFKNSSSKYLGVGWHKLTGKWAAYIRKDDKQYHLGLYETEQDAATAYNKAAIIHHKDFANLNSV